MSDTNREIFVEFINFKKKEKNADVWSITRCEHFLKHYDNTVKELENERIERYR